MADMTPSRIEPLGEGSAENQLGNSKPGPVAKPKTPATPVPDPPAIGEDKETHQLDELA